MYQYIIIIIIYIIIISKSIAYYAMYVEHQKC